MRLIDADALRERLLDAKANQEKRHNGIGLMATTDALIEVEASPTIDAAPVRHGRWIYRKRGWAECSECHHNFVDVYDLDNSDNYCRHCGAKMDGGDHE